MYKILDLFCGAGGSSMGIHLAGLEVEGVDHKPQKRYPFKFYQADAIQFLNENAGEYDGFISSPPCQKYSQMTHGLWRDRLETYPDLIEPTRAALIRTGKPYIIENVPRSPLINPVMLCGTMFQLETKQGSQLLRHRYFETNFFVGLTPPCQHMKTSAIGVYGGGQNPRRRKIPVYGHSGTLSNWRKEKGVVKGFGVADRRDAMGIQWMTNKELSQAIPPAYTLWLSQWLIKELDKRKEGI